MTGRDAHRPAPAPAGASVPSAVALGDLAHVAHDHPALDGHFPGRPILPAVVVLGEVLAALAPATLPTAITAAKFVGIVEPGDALCVAHTITPSGDIRFEVRSARGVVATGTLGRRPAR